MLTKLNEDLPMLAIGFVPRYFSYRDYVKGFVTDSEGRFVGLSQTWLDR
jgi:hypothetical protein